VAMANSSGKVPVSEIFKIGSIMAVIGIIITVIVVFTIGKVVL
jgi:hypothetical protein